MKTIETMKSASMETLCDLYADLVWLRNEVKKLERAMIHAPRDGRTQAGIVAAMPPEILRERVIFAVSSTDFRR